ncbi:hypothetical protein [Limibacterium fermenti]|uniref:hypothetical protein n=1 Tax=Limibacterium fermenti TaxID=3229863 RepID=UPI003A760FEC
MKPLLSVCFLFMVAFAQAQHAQRLSHYVFPEFRQGTVLMKNGARNETLLNYNSLSEEIVFNNHGSLLAIGKQVLPQIDTVFIGDSRFVRIDQTFMEWIEVNEDTRLLVEYKCKLIPPGKPAAYGGTSQTSSVESYSSWLADGRVYDLKLPDEYKVKPYTVYRIGHGGEWKSFSSLNQLRKIYKDKKEAIKAYTKQQKVDFDNPDEVVRLLHYVESNK